jgi:hypothetical protein
MTTISAPDLAPPDPTREWERAVSAVFTDWNHEGMGQKRGTMYQRVAKALEHSLSPFTFMSTDQMWKVCTDIIEGSEMDVNQWYAMLRAGKWHDVVNQVLPVPFEENATRDRMPPPFVTVEDLETANLEWETALRKRFTGWEVDMSGDDPMKEVVWPSLKSRLLWALQLPSLTLLPNHKDTIRQAMKTVDAETIKEMFDLLKAGEWLKGVIELGSTEGVGNSGSLRDIMAHWADTFQGCTLELWRRRLMRMEKTFQQAQQKMDDNQETNLGYYAKTIDIVQSSGMGKSRLVSEMAKEVMTISFVLRTAGETGFPHGDKEILDFVLAGDCTSVKDTHMRAMCLLGGTFFKR